VFAHLALGEGVVQLDGAYEWLGVVLVVGRVRDAGLLAHVVAALVAVQLDHYGVPRDLHGVGLEAVYAVDWVRDVVHGDAVFAYLGVWARVVEYDVALE